MSAAVTTDAQSLKEWAKRIAATAPPPTDDQFAQVHHALLGGSAAPRHEDAEFPRAA